MICTGLLVVGCRFDAILTDEVANIRPIADVMSVSRVRRPTEVRCGAKNSFYARSLVVNLRLHYYANDFDWAGRGLAVPVFECNYGAGYGDCGEDFTDNSGFRAYPLGDGGL